MWDLLQLIQDVPMSFFYTTLPSIQFNSPHPSHSKVLSRFEPLLPAVGIPAPNKQKYNKKHFTCRSSLTSAQLGSMDGSTTASFWLQKMQKPMKPMF